MKTYYEILDINPDATQDEIKSQYRFLLHSYHPDKFRNEEQKKKASKKTREINEAYAVLSKPNKRRLYDNELNRSKSQRNRASTGRASTTSNETAYEAKRRADEKRQREEAENIRQRAEQKRADDERQRQRDAKNRADKEKKRREETENFHQRSEQEKDSFRRHNEKHQRREKAEQGLNWGNSNQFSKSIEALVALFILIFIIVVFVVIFDLLDNSASSVTFIPTNTLTNTPTSIITVTPTSTSTPTVIPTVISPTIAPTIAQGIIFKDDFQDSSTTNANWSSLGGTWVVEDGILSCISNGKYLANITLPEDFTFQLDIMGNNVIDKIIVFRAIDDNTHYGIDFRTAPYNDIVLVKSLPGNVGQIIQAVPFTNHNNTWYTVRVDVNNNHIKVFVNDRLTIDFIDTSFPITGGTIGVGAMLQPGFSVVYYDNIVVTNR